MGYNIGIMGNSIYPLADAALAAFLRTSIVVSEAAFPLLAAALHFLGGFNYLFAGFLAFQLFLRLFLCPALKACSAKI